MKTIYFLVGIFLTSLANASNNTTTCTVTSIIEGSQSQVVLEEKTNFPSITKSLGIAYGYEFVAQLLETNEEKVPSRLALSIRPVNSLVKFVTYGSVTNGNYVHATVEHSSALRLAFTCEISK